MRSKLHIYEWPNCKKSLFLVENVFYFVLERFVYRRQHCQNDPVHVDLQKWLKTLHYAYQATSWRCYFVNKHYTSAHICIPRANTQYACAWSLFSQICVFIVYTEMITVSFSKTCTLKPVFKRLSKRRCCVNERPKCMKQSKNSRVKTPECW